MIDTGVTNRNLLRFIKAGAFDINVGETEPMSDYKWQKMFEIADIHNVGQYVVRGAQMHSGDRWFNFKGSLDEITADLNEAPDIDKDIDRILRMGAKDVEGLYSSLSNGRMRKALENIIYDEMHSEEKNIPALHLLCIIVYNVNTTLTKGMRMNGIVALGRYLREKGDRVDFVKLEAWLKTLMMVHFANLLANVLVELFDFEEGEIPFMHGNDKNVAKLVAAALQYNGAESGSRSYLLQLSGAFDSGDRTETRRNLKRGLRYMRYYPLETVSNFFSKYFKNLPDVEE